MLSSAGPGRECTMFYLGARSRKSSSYYINFQVQRLFLSWHRLKLEQLILNLHSGELQKVLLLRSNVESNPGPELCCICNKKFSKRQSAVWCHRGGWIHLSCSDLKSTSQWDNCYVCETCTWCIHDSQQTNDENIEDLNLLQWSCNGSVSIEMAEIHHESTGYNRIGDTNDLVVSSSPTFGSDSLVNDHFKIEIKEEPNVTQDFWVADTWTSIEALEWIVEIVTNLYLNFDLKQRYERYCNLNVDDFFQGKKWLLFVLRKRKLEKIRGKFLNKIF